MEHFETTTVKVKIHVANCIKCGHDDIILYDDGYSAFNYGGGRCKKCNHKVVKMVGTFPKSSELAEIWNNGNDKNDMIAKYKAQIEELQRKIEDLSK